jgi:hypothetical protein
VGLEKLIRCACRHDVGYHNDYGCGARFEGSQDACSCRMRPHDVVERIIALEVEAARRRWLSDSPVAAFDGGEA